MSGHAIRSVELVVDGMRTPTIESGPADATEAVLFVHGNPGSRLDWEDLVGRAGAVARAVAFDLPGLGQADKPRDFAASVPAYARFIESARRELRIERAHVVVHDFGGAFGLTWAADHPETFASATILNAPPAAGYRWYLLAHVWRTPIAGELLHLTLTRSTFMLLAKRGNPRGLPPAFLERMWQNYDWGTRRTVLKLYRATDARRMVAAEPSRLRDLDRPALIVWGKHDAYIPTRFAERHRTTFPSAQICYLPNSGHFPMIDDPAGTAALVVPFLEEQVGGATA